MFFSSFSFFPFYCSFNVLGGGFVVAGDIETTEDNAFYKSKPSVVETGRKQVIQATLPFHNAAELVEVCTRENMTIAQVVFENERRWRSDVDIKRGLLELWRTMDASITNGCWSTQSHLPGGLNVRRRAPQLFKRLMEKSLPVTPLDPTRPAQPSALVPRQAAKRKDLHTLAFLDWLSCFAIAVNEENACGGKRTGPSERPGRAGGGRAGCEAGKAGAGRAERPERPGPGGLRGRRGRGRAG